LHFLDDDGNLMDAASIAALAALRHFKYPDVTVIGEEVTIVNLYINAKVIHTNYF
jgi:exosome complex component RRP45